MSYSTQNLGSLMDDIGADEGADRGKARTHKREGGQPFWKSQGFAIGLAVVAVAVLSVGMWYSFFSGDAPKTPNTVMLLDVQTGELFEAPTRRLMLPAKNPDSGARVLFPVTEGEDGLWQIGGHYLSGVEYTDYSKEIVLSLQTGAVRVTDSTARKLK